jgi:hypothetical protein
MFEIGQGVFAIGIASFLSREIYRSVRQLEKGHGYLLPSYCLAVMIIAHGILNSFGWEKYLACRHLTLISVSVISGIFLVKAGASGNAYSALIGIMLQITGLLFAGGIESFGKGIRDLRSE